MTHGPFNITQLDANMHVEWTYRNTNTQTCARRPDGTVQCADLGDHPNGFEWCINAPAVASMLSRIVCERCVRNVLISRHSRSMRAPSRVATASR